MPDSKYHIPNEAGVATSDIKPDAALSGTDLSDSDLSDADLMGSDLSGADLSHANLRRANFTGVNLQDADLTSTKLNNADFTSANLLRVNLTNAKLHRTDLTNAVLADSVLTDAILSLTDFSDAALVGVDLSSAELHGATLSDADLMDANLTEADLLAADLTEANLQSADLSDTNLGGTDFTDANLQGVDFSGANIHGVDLTGVTLARSTQIDAPGEQIQNGLVDEDSTSEEHQYDIIARTNHELRTAYSANGLIGRARSARVRERRARRKEAFAEGGARGYTAWFGSLLSKVFTGYGVQLTWITAVIAALYLVSAGVYHFAGEMSVGRSLYYSVVTFTTSPPETPPPGLTSVVAGIETFAGTAAIVFLGYVLGTRERV